MAAIWIAQKQKTILARIGKNPFSLAPLLKQQSSELIPLNGWALDNLLHIYSSIGNKDWEKLAILSNTDATVNLYLIFTVSLSTLFDFYRRRREARPQHTSPSLSSLSLLLSFIPFRSVKKLYGLLFPRLPKSIQWILWLSKR